MVFPGRVRLDTSTRFPAAPTEVGTFQEVGLDRAASVPRLHVESGVSGSPSTIVARDALSASDHAAPAARHQSADTAGFIGTIAPVSGASFVSMCHSHVRQQLRLFRSRLPLLNCATQSALWEPPSRLHTGGRQVPGDLCTKRPSVHRLCASVACRTPGLAISRRAFGLAPAVGCVSRITPICPLSSAQIQVAVAPSIEFGRPARSLAGARDGALARVTDEHE